MLIILYPTPQQRIEQAYKPLLSCILHMIHAPQICSADNGSFEVHEALLCLPWHEKA